MTNLRRAIDDFGLVLVLMVIVSAPAFAVDGEQEIDQTCAML